MSKTKPPQDDRKTFRCTVVEGLQACQLKVGSQVLSATLQDESAGGFSVLVDQPPGLEVDQTCELHATAGWFEVAVVHVMQVLPPEGTPPAEIAKRGPWFRLGLRRLSEALPPKPPHISHFAASLYVHLSQWYPSGGVLAMIGLLLAIAVVSVPLVVMGMNWGAGRHATDQVLKIPFSGGPQNVHLDDWTFKGGSATGARSDDAAEFHRALKNVADRTPDVALLAMPYAGRELQFTGAQQEQIRRLIAATSQAVRDLDAQLESEKRPELVQLRAQVIDEAYRTALTLLTDQQRAQWEKMTAKQ